MTKSELIKQLLTRFPNMLLGDVQQAVDTVFTEMSNNLIDQNRIEIRGFGAFTTRTREPRTARNPKTNEQIHIGKRTVLHFKAGKELNEILNETIGEDNE